MHTTQVYTQELGYTPFFLMFRRQAHLPVDVAFGLPPNSETTHNASLRVIMQEAYEKVRKDLVSVRKKFDTKAHGHPYKKGDMVWLHNVAVARGKSVKKVS